MLALTSNIQPWQPLIIKYIPSNVTGSFLDPTPTGTGVERDSASLTFERNSDGDYTATLPVLTQEDDALDSGSFTVALQNGANDSYIPTTDNTKSTTTTVNVISVPMPVLSFTGDVTIKESQTATLTISTTTEPKRELKISYTPVETLIAGIMNYLDESALTDLDGNTITRTSGTPPN